MLVRWSQITLLQIKVSLLEWSNHFLITDYAGHAEIEEKNIVHIQGMQYCF